MDNPTPQPPDCRRYPAEANVWRTVFNLHRTRMPVLMILSFVAGCTESPHIVGQAEWSPPMSDLLARYPGISSSIAIHQHDAFVDSKYAWKINGQSDEIDKLIRDLNLQDATPDHSKFEELKHSIPDTWNLPKVIDSQVYVSEGYGTKHQEGVDLLLLVRDTTQDETIVLYEWIF